MRYKAVQFTPSKNDVLITIYPTSYDYSDTDNEGIWWCTIRNLEDIIKEVCCDYDFVFPYSYVQAKFSYPMFNQKLETLTEWKMGTEKMQKLATDVTKELITKFFDEIDLEYQEMSHKNFSNFMSSYGNDDGYSAPNLLLEEGQILVYMLSSESNTVDEPFFDRDFEDDRVCIRYNKKGLVECLHKKDHQIRYRLENEIRDGRKKCWEDEQFSGEDDSLW